MSYGPGWGGPGGPAGGGPGWGPPPPHWGGWPPPAPKPGVVPLRPLQVGDIYGSAFQTIRGYWKPLFGISALVHGAVLVLAIVAAVVGYSTVSGELSAVFDALGDSDAPAAGDVVTVLWALGGLYLVILLGMLAATGMVYATCAAVLREAVLGRPAPFGQIWRAAWRRVPTVLGAVLLSGIIAAVPLLLFLVGFAAAVMSVIPGSSDLDMGSWASIGILGGLASGALGIWLWVRISLATSAAVFEDQRVVGALRRSARLVRGDWWRVFGVQLLAAVMVMVVSQAVQLILEFVTGLGSSGDPTALTDSGLDIGLVVAQTAIAVLVTLGAAVLVQIAGAVFLQLTAGLLYVDLRIRREALADSLLNSVQPQGHPGPAAPPAY